MALCGWIVWILTPEEPDLINTTIWPSDDMACIMACNDMFERSQDPFWAIVCPQGQMGLNFGGGGWLDRGNPKPGRGVGSVFQDGLKEPQGWGCENFGVPPPWA